MKLVTAEGPPGNLMIVGDYPTKEEYANGRAFYGSMGRMMFRLLEPTGIDASNVYSTHIYKVPVVGYDVKSKRQKQEALDKINQIENWREILKSEIEAINPNCILALGELALQNLTEQKGIEKWRGSILTLNPELSNGKTIKVVPIHSPREIWQRDDKPFAYTQWDCAKAAKMSKIEGDYYRHELIWIVKSAIALSNWWERVRGCGTEFLTCDIEIHCGFITCIGFSHDGLEAISVPLLFGPKVDYQERGFYYKLVYEILSSRIPKVNQNIKFDWMFLEKFGFIVNNIVGDTMLMAHTIYPELPKGLDFLTSIYTEHPYYKDEGKKFDPKIHSPDRLLLYNARDALVTWQIWRDQQKDAEAQKVRHFFFENVIPSFFIYKKIEERGVRVDDTRRQVLLTKYGELLKDNNTIINMVAEQTINPLSPKQVGQLVYEILKCPKHTHKTPKGVTVYSTDEKTLEEIYVTEITDEARKDVLKRILVARKLARVIEFLRVPISQDGRMRTSFKLHGTENGRTSAGKCLETSFKITNDRIEEIESGGSFQTIPKHGFEFGPEIIGNDLRTIFVPSPGYVFVDGDQSQAEARVVCLLAEDYKTLELFDTIDIHTLTATWVLNKKFEDITKEERQEYGKKPRHAGNYNMSHYELARQTHKPLSEMKLVMEKFHQNNPNIRGIFHAQVREHISKYRFLISPHGRRRDFFGRVTDDMFKEGFACIPQATVSDHNKFTILRKMVDLFPEPIAYPFSESHDNLAFEVRREASDTFSEKFLEIISTPINFSKCSLSRNFDLIIPGEIEIGEESWGTMRRWKG